MSEQGRYMHILRFLTVLLKIIVSSSLVKKANAIFQSIFHIKDILRLVQRNFQDRLYTTCVLLITLKKIFSIVLNYVRERPKRPLK